MNNQTGFSLAEAMVVVAIIAILAVVASPNFGGMTDSTRVRKAADLIAQTLAFARSEAMDKNATRWLVMKSGTPNTVCISTTNVHACDVRNERLPEGVAVVPTSEIAFNGTNGSTTSQTTFTVSKGNANKSVTVNILGLVSVQ